MTKQEQQAREYTAAYASKYGIIEEGLLAAIYRGHLAYLLSLSPMDEVIAEYEAETERQMDLIDRVDEMDEEGVFDLDRQEPELDAFEWHRQFRDWKRKVAHDVGLSVEQVGQAVSFEDWLSDEHLQKLHARLQPTQGAKTKRRCQITSRELIEDELVLLTLKFAAEDFVWAIERATGIEVGVGSEDFFAGLTYPQLVKLARFLRPQYARPSEYELARMHDHAEEQEDAEIRAFFGSRQGEAPGANTGRGGSMTKVEAVARFKEDVLPFVRERYEQDGVRDIPARSEAWNNYTDALCREGLITLEQCETWSGPRCCRRKGE